MVDELITALFREILLAEELLGAVDLVLGLVTLLAGAVLVLLQDAVEEVIARAAELIHEAILLGLASGFILGHVGSSSGVDGLVALVLELLLRGQ